MMTETGRYVYVIGTYGEHGIEQPVATTDRTKLSEMLDAWIARHWWPGRGVEKEKATLATLLKESDAELADDEYGYDLGDEWGGIKFYVIELEGVA